MTALNVSLTDRYEIERMLGSGTGGVVYLGRDRASGDRVAIKHFCHSGSQGKLIVHEASAILGLDHPHIVRCLDFFYLGGRDLYLVYEFVGGGSLRDRLEEHPKMELEEMLGLARQVLEALDCLHGRGIIHCDIKPENILVTRGDGQRPSYKLTDFGVAHFLPQLAANGRGIAGSPAYLAPERLYDTTFSFSSDLYSLGIILYEVIAGQRPFEGTPREIARQHLRKEPDYSHVPDERIRDFLRSLLEKNPTYRVREAREAMGMVEALTPYCSNRDAARPPAPGPGLIVPPSARPIAEGRLLRVHPPIQAGRLREVADLDLPGDHERILLLGSVDPEGAKGPVVAVERGSHFAFYRADEGRQVPACLSSNGLAITSTGPTGIAYSTRSRICHFDASTGVEQTLVHDCFRVVSVHVSPCLRFVLWADANFGHFLDRERGHRLRFPCRNFGLVPHMQFMGPERFVYSAGPVSPALKVHDATDGDLLEEIALEGPVLEMARNAEGLLALTLSLDGRNRYVLYHVDDDLRAEKTYLPEGVEQLATSSAHIMALLKEGFLQTYRTTSRIDLGGPIDLAARAIYCSWDNRYFASLLPGGSRSILRCYENLAAHEN